MKLKLLVVATLSAIPLGLLARHFVQMAEIEATAKRQSAYQIMYLQEVRANCIKDGGIPSRGYNEVICLRSREVMWRRKESP